MLTNTCKMPKNVYIGPYLRFFVRYMPLTKTLYFPNFLSLTLNKNKIREVALTVTSLSIKYYFAFNSFIPSILKSKYGADRNVDSEKYEIPFSLSMASFVSPWNNMVGGFFE